MKDLYATTRKSTPTFSVTFFEKYINQKQMGAYYTKEDITGYISKNTIIPWLFDATKKKCEIAFQPDSSLWRLLKDDPDFMFTRQCAKALLRVKKILNQELQKMSVKLFRCRWTLPPE